MSKTSILLLLFVHLFSHIAYSQNTSNTLNLSIWNPVATTKSDSLSTTKLTFGLLQSKVNHLTGLGANIIGGEVTGNLSGVQTSGIYSYIKGKADGIVVTGMINIVSGAMRGVEFGGLLNMNLNSVKGIQMSLVNNTSIGTMRGIQVTVGYNVASSEASGIQFSPIANIAAKGANILQIGGIFNVSLHSMKGLQTSIGNFADTIKGVQIGALNISTKIVKGAQIGFFNYSNQQSGTQIGLVNISPSSQLDLMVYGGNFLYTNVAVRFRNEYTYSVIGIGFPYSTGGDFSGGLFYRYGISAFTKQRFGIKADAGVYFINIFDDNNYKDLPMQQYSLQGRLSVEYRVGIRTNIFINGGWSFTSENGKSTFKGKPIVEGGLNIFLTSFLGHN